MDFFKDVSLHFPVFGDFLDTLFFYFKCNFILVRWHSLYDFILLKFIETCFVVQYMV